MKLFCTTHKFKFWLVLKSTLSLVESEILRKIDPPEHGGPVTREAGAGGGEGGAGARGGRVVEAGQVGDGRGPGHRNTCLQIVISLS